ncbi:MAG: hypothetical protein GY833_12670 [Aestuariibacter sp.]|nr:hypothetical protein [Aestuariibacter sp.]|tara:strand:+ start:123289 stop:123693 length:405 start_codon:yes stop_codon:yes gene_type:complete
MFKRIILAYYRRFPTPQMVDDLQVDYIHPPHGIDRTNHLLPHSHLWDRLDWETIPFTERESVMYIRFMDDDHLEKLIERGKSIRFHIHGEEGGGIHQERLYLQYNYRKVIRRMADGFFIIGGLLAAAGIALMVR